MTDIMSIPGQTNNPYAPPSAGASRNPDYNPYAPPSANLESNAAPSDVEAVRRELLKHETSIRSFGTLYLLGFAFTVLATVGLALVTIASPTAEDRGILILLTVLYGLLAVLNYHLGQGLRRLDKKIRGLATFLSVLGLIAFPIGTLINGYFLYLLHSEKGKRVMTPEYQEVIAKTPHIKYKTPVWLIVLALLILGLVVFGMVAVFSA